MPGITILCTPGIINLSLINAITGNGIPVDYRLSGLDAYIKVLATHRIEVDHLVKETL
jgi:hypothetical protein